MDVVISWVNSGYISMVGFAKSQTWGSEAYVYSSFLVSVQQLEKMQEEKQLVEKPFERKPITFRFPELERSGRTVIQIKNLCFRYEDKVHFLDYFMAGLPSFF
jgi:ATPase subunit of ABC transporter with duplicated ATPase domains